MKCQKSLFLLLEGRSLLINLQHRMVLHRFNFKAKVYDIKFSPNGK